MLTNREIDLVRESFACIAPCGDEFSRDFYNSLFSRQPALQLLFSDDLVTQRKKLIEMIAAAAGMLGEPEKLVPVLEESGRRHALYGVRERHYETVGAAFLQALNGALGAKFDGETRAAWTRLLKLMSETMIRGARSLHEAGDETIRRFDH